jgi:hypothetical protein
MIIIMFTHFCLTKETRRSTVSTSRVSLEITYMHRGAGSRNCRMCPTPKSHAVRFAFSIDTLELLTGWSATHLGMTLRRRLLRSHKSETWGIFPNALHFLLLFDPKSSMWALTTYRPWKDYFEQIFDHKIFSSHIHKQYLQIHNIFVMTALLSSSLYISMSTSKRPYINRQRNQRVMFALFTKILCNILKKSGDSDLHRKAKDLVTTTVRRSRMGDEECCPLFESIETRLRGLVGEAHWRRAHGYMHFYAARNPEILLPPKNLHCRIGSHAAWDQNKKMTTFQASCPKITFPRGTMTSQHVDNFYQYHHFFVHWFMIFVPFSKFWGLARHGLKAVLRWESRES